MVERKEKEEEEEEEEEEKCRFVKKTERESGLHLVPN
jgi:hypothetical protein